MSEKKELYEYLSEKETVFTKINNDKVATDEPKIFLPSKDEIMALPMELRQAKRTDFAGGNNPNGSYWLRDKPRADAHEAMQCDGKDEVDYVGKYEDFIDEHPFGLRPMFFVDKSFFEESGQKTKAIKNKAGKIVGHTINFGEMPQTKLDDGRGQMLEKIYQEDGNMYEGYHRTNKVFCSFRRNKLDDDSIMMTEKCPEVFWRGEKYVRKLNQDHKPEWFLVEPIECIITNWDDLPTTINPKGTGKDTAAKLLTKNVLNSPSMKYSYRYWPMEEIEYWAQTDLCDYLNLNLGSFKEPTFFESCFLGEQDRYYCINTLDNNDTRDVMKYLNIALTGHERQWDDLLNIAQEYGKKYVIYDGSWALTNEKDAKKYKFCETVANFKQAFGKVRIDELNDLHDKNIQNLESYFLWAQKYPDYKVPFSLTVHMESNEEMCKHNQLFREKICKKYLENLSQSTKEYLERTYTLHRERNNPKTAEGQIWQMAQRLQCFSGEEVLDANGKPCTKAERGIKILDQILDQTLTSGKFDVGDITTEEELKFLEKHTKDLMKLVPYDVDGSVWRMLLLYPDAENAENIMERVKKFEKDIMVPYIKNDKYILKALQGQDASPEDIRAKIFKFAFDIGYFNDSIWKINNFCTDFNACARQTELSQYKALLPTDFEPAKIQKTIEKNLEMILKNPKLISMIMGDNNQEVVLSDDKLQLVRPMPVLVAGRDFLPLSRLCTIASIKSIMKEVITDDSLRQYAKLVDQISHMKSTGVVYPATFLAKTQTHKHWNDKEFKGNVFQQIKGSPMMNKDDYELVGNISRARSALDGFYQFAHFMGCFDDTPIDKNSFVKSATYAQRGSTILGKILKSGQTNARHLGLLVQGADRNLSAIPPCKEFLDFIGHQDKTKYFDNLDLLLEIGHNIGESVLVDLFRHWPEVAAQQAMDENNHINKLDWKSRIEQYMAQHVYCNVLPDNQELALLCKSKQVSQTEFEKIQAIFEQAKVDNVPDHVLGEQIVEDVEKLKQEIAQDLLNSKKTVEDAHKKLFYYEMLSKADPKNAFIGNYVDCCCFLTSAAWGAQIAKVAITQKDVQHMVLRNVDGEIVGKASMYFSEEQRSIIINELDLRQTERHKKEEAFGAFMRGIEKVVQVYDKKHPDAPLEYVVAGMGHTKLAEQTARFKKISQNLTVPVEYGFADARNDQRILYDRQNGLAYKVQNDKTIIKQMEGKRI